MSLTIHPLSEADRSRVRVFMIEHWGDEFVVAHGVIYRPAGLPGFGAWVDGEAVGLITYHLDGDSCEIVTLNSLREGRGIGAALITAVHKVARRAGCRRLWLITTNDNLRGLGFYQKRGFRLMALRPGAVAEARKLKPTIPLTGNDGIPLRDELELELSPLEAAAEGDQATG